MSTAWGEPTERSARRIPTVSYDVIPNDFNKYSDAQVNMVESFTSFRFDICADEQSR
jgi:hypothetical protein